MTTVFSGISAGTELSYVKDTNPFLSEPWDPASAFSCQVSRTPATRSPGWDTWR